LKAVAFHEAMQPEFAAYQRSVVSNAAALAEELRGLGLRIVSGGTDNHLVLVDLTSTGLTGKAAEQSLELAGNPYNLTASQFWAARAAAAVILGGLITLLMFVTNAAWTQRVLYPLLAAAIGFFLPVLWLSSQRFPLWD
jgi:hypothetical protein